MSLYSSLFRLISICALAGAAVIGSNAQGVKRIVIIKMDGLPGYYVDRFVNKPDPATGRSTLPWIEEVFYRNGTRLPNFYTRGMSLSGPAWGQLDTGRRLQIKGNVEYDRYTLHAYDYLNFFPYYLGYGMGKKVDMPAVEVLDQLEIPMLADAFPHANRYTSHQLYQRGNDWGVLANGFIALYPGSVLDFMNEWTIGLKFRSTTIKQAERDIIAKLDKRPHIDYFDYYDTEFDHVSHHNNDLDSRLSALKQIDRLIGRVWTAIRSSPRADETALVLISDHGFNSTENAYSQGFNIVKMLGSRAGGGHHVVTKRRLMLDYTVKGLYPLTPIVRTMSPDSYYLKGQGDPYPTALVDFDGNERTSIHLRNSDLNLLHILHQQIQKGDLKPEVKKAAIKEFSKIISRNAPKWRRIVDELSEELLALVRRVREQSGKMSASGKKPAKNLPRGESEKIRRAAELIKIDESTEGKFRDYLKTLNNLISLSEPDVKIEAVKIEDIVAPGSMGEQNSLYQLQNYVVGLSPRGLILDADGSIDTTESFTRIDYFKLLHDQRVRNDVQRGVGNRPVDMVALRLPVDSLRPLVDEEIEEDAVWLYGGAERQALLLSRVGANGEISYRYLPISNLKADPAGKLTFDREEMGPGFPLQIFEDPDFAVAAEDRIAWLGSWQTERDWVRATHRTRYATAVVGLSEHVQRHPLYEETEEDSLSSDQRLIRRFRQRQRDLTEADMLVLANTQWNFDVRGFNPGGNHGAFFRASTNSTFMIAGGENTGIPRGLAVAEPYDSLSFVPTILRLMGKVDEKNRPVPDLAQRGFKQFPGRVVSELVETSATSRK